MNIWSTLAVLGLIILLGTAGAADINIISTNQIIIQSLIGVSFLCVGVRGALNTHRFQNK